MELKVAFFKDLDVNAVREAQKNFAKMESESRTVRTNLAKSED